MNSEKTRVCVSTLICALAIATILLPSRLAAQDPRVAFVTSVFGDGNLGSWPDSGIEVGVAAADEICQERATVAGLANPGNFVAWLSTTTDDAYCRLHGFSGKKSANCGQVELPVGAGPWVRTDGLPFSETIDRLLTPESVVYYPLEVDEFGDVVTTQTSTYTMTGEDGALNPLTTTCNDWTDNSAQNVKGGPISFGSQGWTLANTGICNFAARLYCFETGAGPPLPAPGPVSALAFLTSVNGTGDLSTWADAGGETGIDAADSVCQARATAAGLDHSSSFKAWISDSASNAIDRFLDLGPRTRVDGVRIADSMADLTDGKLDAALNVTELGDYIGNRTVWTSTTVNGTYAPDSCTDWTSGSDAQMGRAGSAWNSSSSWTLVFNFDCDRSSRLYCLSDPPPIFIDGFESGDTGEWTDTVP